MYSNFAKMGKDINIIKKNNKIIYYIPYLKQYNSDYYILKQIILSIIYQFSLFQEKTCKPLTSITVEKIFNELQSLNDILLDLDELESTTIKNIRKIHKKLIKTNSNIENIIN